MTNPIDGFPPPRGGPPPPPRQRPPENQKTNQKTRSWAPRPPNKDPIGRVPGGPPACGKKPGCRDPRGLARGPGPIGAPFFSVGFFLWSPLVWRVGSPEAGVWERPPRGFPHPKRRPPFPPGPRRAPPKKNPWGDGVALFWARFWGTPTCRKQKFWRFFRPFGEGVPVPKWPPELSSPAPPPLRLVLGGAPTTAGFSPHSEVPKNRVRGGTFAPRKSDPTVFGNG